jgi:hypothetical protein
MINTYPSVVMLIDSRTIYQYINFLIINIGYLDKLSRNIFSHLIDSPKLNFKKSIESGPAGQPGLNIIEII